MAHEMPGVAKVLIITGGLVDGGQIISHINNLGGYAQQLHSANPDSVATFGGIAAIAVGAVIDKIAQRRTEDQEVESQTRRTSSQSGPNPMHDGRVQHRPRVPQR